MTDLKPCPFCAGKAKMCDDGSKTDPSYYDFYVLASHNTPCLFEYYDVLHFETEEEAFSFWNTRPMEGELLSMLEEILEKGFIFGSGKDNIDENKLYQLIQKAKGQKLSTECRTMQGIGDLLNGR